MCSDNPVQRAVPVRVQSKALRMPTGLIDGNTTV